MPRAVPAGPSRGAAFLSAGVGQMDEKMAHLSRTLVGSRNGGGPVGDGNLLPERSRPSCSGFFRPKSFVFSSSSLTSSQAISRSPALPK
jgi:hypothetical protein